MAQILSFFGAHLTSMVQTQRRQEFGLPNMSKTHLCILKLMCTCVVFTKGTEKLSIQTQSQANCGLHAVANGLGKRQPFGHSPSSFMKAVGW